MTRRSKRPRDNILQSAEGRNLHHSRTAVHAAVRSRIRESA
jgi:hypothetical protein